MPVTMCRVNLVKGLGPAMQIAEGWTIELPDDVHDVLDQRTNPTWPTTWFVPRTTGSGPFRDVYTVMSKWREPWGHLRRPHRRDSSWLCVPCCASRSTCTTWPKTNSSRPSAWAAFGANEPMGADFRACQNYGPLYG